jgi:hypothetical protein
MLVLPVVPGVSKCVEYAKLTVIGGGLICLPLQLYREPESPHAEDGPQTPNASDVKAPIVAQTSAISARLTAEQAKAVIGHGFRGWTIS